jgi:hypothetical protein
MSLQPVVKALGTTVMFLHAAPADAGAGMSAASRSRSCRSASVRASAGALARSLVVIAREGAPTCRGMQARPSVSKEM